MEAQTILENRIASTLELDSLRSGQHVVRDVQGRKTGEVSVLGVWAVHILPSFHPPATVAVVMEEHRALGGFAVVVGVNETWDTAAVIDTQLEPDWVDPVAGILSKINLFDFDGGLSLDGISYELKTDTLAGKSRICFSNPVTQPLIELEQAIFQVASEVTALAGGPLEKKYLVTWQEYLAR